MSKNIECIDNLAYLKATGSLPKKVMNGLKKIKMALFFISIVSALFYIYFILNNNIMDNFFIYMGAFLFPIFFIVAVLIDNKTYSFTNVFIERFDALKLSSNFMYDNYLSKKLGIEIKDEKKFKKVMNNELDIFKPQKLSQKEITDGFHYWSKVLDYSKDNIELQEICIKKIEEIKERENEINQKIENFNKNKIVAENILKEKRILKNNSIQSSKKVKVLNL